MSPATLWGKLPAHGDFVARGISADERDTLDAWLAGSLDDARATLGTAFADTYDQAPPWRFVARSARGWTAGAMAASIDGVGRRYPVMAARDGLADTEVDGVAEAVETLLYEALAGGWDADQLAAAVAAVPATPSSPWTYGDRWWTLGGEWFDEAALAGDRPPLLMRSVLSMRQGDE